MRKFKDSVYEVPAALNFELVDSSSCGGLVTVYPGGPSGIDRLPQGFRYGRAIIEQYGTSYPYSYRDQRSFVDLQINVLTGKYDREYRNDNTGYQVLRTSDRLSGDTENNTPTAN